MTQSPLAPFAWASVVNSYGFITSEDAIQHLVGSVKAVVPDSLVMLARWILAASFCLFLAASFCLILTASFCLVPMASFC